MLQVKFEFRLICPLGLGDKLKETENQPKLNQN